MKQTKFFLPALMAMLGSIVFHSCGKCGGCDEIFTTNGANILVYDSTINLNEPSAFASISVEAIGAETKGDRNCLNKDLVLCPQDGLSVEKMNIICDKELMLKEGTIPAMTNLFEVKYVLETADSGPYPIPYIILRARDNMPPGLYTFILSGTTKEGKPLKDTTKITWY